MKKLRKTLCLLLALMLLLSVAGCGQEKEAEAPKTETAEKKEEPKAETKTEEKKEEKPEEPKEKIITVGMTTNMSGMDAFGAQGNGRNLIRYPVYEYLAVFTSFGQTYDQMQKQIAKEIRQISDTVFEVEIYDYVKDAAGVPITADDIVFSYTTLDESSMVSRFTKYLDYCKKIDDYTVEIGISTDIIGAFEYVLCQGNIVSKESYEANGDKNATTPITTGPYQITECVTDSYYILSKNENYWQTDESLRSDYSHQPVDKFRVDIITEAQQAATALQTGNIDLLTTVKTSNIGFFMNEDGSAKEGFAVNEIADTVGVLLGFNLKEGELFADNLPLRQAMCYAIDTDAIVNNVLDGHGKVLVDLATSACGDANPKWKDEDYYKYNFEKAKELLAEAGYPEGVDPASKAPLHIRLMTASAYEQAAVVVQAQLIALGLDIELISIDDSMISTYRVDPTAFDLIIAKNGVDGNVTNAYDSELAQDKNGWGARTFIVDDVLEEKISIAHSIATHSQETVDDLHYYVKDNCLKYGLYTGTTISAGKAGIEIYNHPWGPLVFNACDFSGYFD